jgi:hypothetical protein
VDPIAAYRLGVFLADSCVTAAAAWLLVCATRHHRHGGLEAALAWAWSFIALIAGAGVILGGIGGFGANGFLAAHAIVLAVLAGARKRALTHDVAALRHAGRQLRGVFARPGAERLIAGALSLALGALTVIAAWAEPAVFDTLTYHLPRIGHWLQEGRIDIIDTTDTRLNFVAVLPDIVMAWLTGGTREGFRLVVLAQAAGGVMSVAATIGLARATGLTRSAALLAGALLLGMANVVAQFTAAQTDLFTTGVFAAAFYLWLCALRRGEVSTLGALGAGLALGAKGTLFYLAPGALLWVGWLALQHRLTWRQWRQTLLTGAAGVALFAGPGFLRNWQTYGDPLGPEEWVRKHHQGYASAAALTGKLSMNLTASLAQLLEPHSQPRAFHDTARAVGEGFAGRLPERDSHTLDNLSRRDTLASVLKRRVPDADVASFGAVLVVLYIVGTVLAVVAWRRRRAGQRISVSSTPEAAFVAARTTAAADAGLVLVWSAGVAIFVVFFHGMQQWHPYGFRYFVLAAPWIAIVAAWGMEQWSRLPRIAVWTFALATAADVGWHVTVHSHQSGWRSVVQPARSRGYYVYSGWREWSQQLDRADAPFSIALPEERPIGAFYRQRPSREVRYVADDARAATAEEFVRDQPGWVIVPAARFVGREGRVAASVWWFDGTETSPFSVAAYRRLQPAETPPGPRIYQHEVTRRGDATRHEILLKTWSSDRCDIVISNTAGTTWRYEVITPAGHQIGRIEPNSTHPVEIGLPAGAVSQVIVDFVPSDAATAMGPPPTVQLAPHPSPPLY